MYATEECSLVENYMPRSYRGGDGGVNGALYSYVIKSFYRGGDAANIPKKRSSVFNKAYRGGGLFELYDKAYGGTIPMRWG